MVILHVPLLFQLFFSKKFNAFAVYPFVFIRNNYLRDNQRLKRHEAIHHQQQLELLILPFFILYFLEFIYHFVQLRNGYLAYRAISFEKEAYQHDGNLQYLHNRKWFAMWRRFD